MPYTGTDICAAAAVDLNDAAQGSYTNAVLLPHLKAALRKLKSEFIAASLPYTLVQSDPTAVPASAVNTSITVTKLLFEPLELFEGGPSDALDSYVPMIRKTFLPIMNVQNTLRYWMWSEQLIQVPPCSAARVVIVRFIKDLTMITLVSDAINITGAELFLQKKTAALAAAYIGENYTRAGILSDEADKELDILLRSHVKNEQSIPAVRKPYRGNKCRLR